MRQIYYSIRTLLRERGSNLIRVISLSLGLTIGILLFSQIVFELSYENCYPEAERLAMVRAQITNLSTGEIMGDDGTNYDYTVFAPTANAVAESMPEEVEYASCVLPEREYNIYYEEKLLSDVDYIYVDSCFFQVFGIPLLKGNLKDLIIPGSVFVSERFARETFADEDPVGKILSADKQNTFTIRGVYKDVPENTMLTHDFVVSIYNNNGGYQAGNGWNGNDVFYTFLRLRRESDMDKVNDNIQRVIEKYTETTIDDWKMDYSIIPLVKRHLDSPDVQKRLVIYGFLGFAIFFVAIMNYMLISIATLSRRAKSVGVHKCSGASSTNIFSMFLAETGILVILSVLLSFLLIFNAREMIEDLLSVRLSSLFTWGTLWVPLLTILVLFILAGGIPGRLFSRIPVTQVFRRYTDGKKGWKRSLLFVQFTGVSFVLGLLLVTLLQYGHLMNRDMGIDVTGLTEAESWLPKERVEHIKDELRRQPMVEGVTVATHSVLGQYWTRGLMSNDGKRLATLNFNYCHYNYPEVMGIKIIEGTPMKKGGDLLVNEELVRLMRWTDGAVGKRVNNVAGTVVGVFRDIRNESFYAAQSPIILIGTEEQANHTFDVRLKEPFDENLKRLNEYMEKTFPDVSLHFMSVDHMVKDLYKDVYRFRNSVWITSCFILLIVIMGLIGYVNDETQRRSKEIAIRKVNGAEAFHVLRLLTRDILYVSVLSILIGTAVSYFAGRAWLDQFAEQIELNPLLFIGTALFIQLLIIVCVVLKAWHIANENPVNSIKNE
ncbi:FtsX-like permease family protein [Bacteroides salyersiae]|uniref:ABC transporter permease n=1 Tax=Bacteroides salyersiae TaxID=291644 RepID=UPI00125CF32E|nr:FtsX-like permease family protein [Bacteroides salyersiae]KAB5345783.1 FtsX-like permease family protein [Bacteroides salyersiae]KAB5353030.1 FtsX-like permease family protein [Bacteroides salyersiae]KAB5364107.1 FtsX-like permease family protein [Bacteroides salyersiae]KAB5367427.1 FtsX-like permease family protein [Bacteroides salyersiae]KAB5370012.1 FtsX-like permease family protein [Bacteroides salyersiae]